ncbi:uncharacterized protein LOC110629764 [Manihot esculenta]|uniref:Uncharacterized protein n=1 Tax=Manihot esculenta TaxID=3983 RepID=A0A2C9UR70_MANES|nr:uncharacterized protein LOC110629764 [Manihot esculenta]XP_043805469.1 uncharacterized protein LOC110629764 [Manihot esculenta]XP_043805470.1 uncharacterized protein LOC110629764 [Manihot esculenta]XP_043805471.1 uncharacterized protein LOC110629764 [Manihot esculenta]XP_043805473.1 uncharacterized protein LOC110629764 [Manihot esculenta]XP_043805474.1 uncharacterized protein LOC110629764 [Manihot esculenta]OAY33760.1 hypothetical protein MANES_13G122300v8 [Manihot esculenta]
MASCHIRSISLPSRSHPLTVNIEEQLCKLNASQSSSIEHKLSGLKNLFKSVDDILELSLAQRTISSERQSHSVENAINGSLELLDICDTTRDLFSQMKECLQELELSLRRRKGGDSSFTSEVDAHMVSRKKLNKAISKCLRNLKKKERNFTAATLDNNSNLENMISLLSTVQEISLVMFESILSFVSQPKVKSLPSSWLVIPKLLQSKRISCEVEIELNAVEKIDAELLILKSSNDINLSQLQKLLKGLETLESSIQKAEEELECIYRRLVKIRVSLLNIQNH